MGKHPNINENGTDITNVPVWSRPRNAATPDKQFYGTHSKAMTNLYKIMGEYIKADFSVRMRIYHDDAGFARADLICLPWKPS